MKILVICQYYYPEEFQITDICEELAKQGNEVTVLTGLPNYPTGKIPEKYQHGKNREENINGVQVIRCYERPREKGILGLSANYISFMLSSLLKIRKLKKKCDVIYIHQYSPVVMGISGVFAKYLFKKKIFLYCCDLWPESIKAMNIKETSIIFKLVTVVSRFIYLNCDLIGVQTTAFFPYLKNVHGIDVNKLVYIPQFADSVYLNQNFKKEHEGINFVFLGNIGLVQDMECIVEAVSINVAENILYKVHIVGDGSYLNNLKQLVENKNLKNYFLFYGRRPVEEMMNFYEIADACLLTLKDDSFIGHTVPGKLQGYMAAGKTIIAAINGPAQQIIQEAHCGLVCNASNAIALANNIKKFIIHRSDYYDCGNNGREYFRKNFTKERCVARTIEILNKLKGDN